MRITLNKLRDFLQARIKEDENIWSKYRYTDIAKAINLQADKACCETILEMLANEEVFEKMYYRTKHRKKRH